MPFTPAAKEKVIEIIRAGETFAESVALLDKPYPVFAGTIEKSNCGITIGQDERAWSDFGGGR